MRRRLSLKCCVSFVFSLGIIYIFILLTSVDLDIFFPAEGVGRKHFIPRNHRPEQLSKSDVCQSLKNEHNPKVELHYDISVLNLLGLIETPEDQIIRDEGYRSHAFNLLISDRLGYHRALPDNRHPRCQDKTYPTDLPKVTVIICFHNEAASALLRTVHSVLDRTPGYLLQEIILIDDNSDLDHLSCQIESYVKNHLSKVRYIKSATRQGLIRARMLGANQAEGQSEQTYCIQTVCMLGLPLGRNHRVVLPACVVSFIRKECPFTADGQYVLVFLDSHCEVNVDWLQPLLQRIKENRVAVVTPIIDIINAETMELQTSPLVVGGFNWGLHFRWDPLPTYIRDNPSIASNPVKSPTMAGGLFAIDTSFYFELGEYDAGMDIWGGENLELSFRIWQCGGTLEIIPCSRVGHIFRKRRPYGSANEGDTMMKNSLRVANVWMDDYKKYFYKQRPESTGIQFGDISDRLALRKRLKCHSFDWYLKNVYPEQVLPNSSALAPQVLHKQEAKKSSIVRKAQLVHSSSGLCVQGEKDVYTKRSLLILQHCGQSGRDKKYQIWHETSDNELILASILCLDVEAKEKGHSYARLMKCHGSKGSQSWVWTKKSGISLLYHPASGKCLKATNLSKRIYLTLDICRDHSDMGFEMLT